MVAIFYSCVCWLATRKLSLIVAQCLSIHLSICVSVRDSLSPAYVRSIARREPRRLPACFQNVCPMGFELCTSLVDRRRQ